MIAAPPRALGALTICAAALLALFAASATGAATGPITGGTCPLLFTTPFSTWSDLNQYWPVKDGGFEQATGSDWSLTGGAKVVSGNESFYVHSKSDSHSLLIPPGGSVTFTPVCVTTNSPIMRFFAEGGTSPLAVTATYATAGGTAQATLGSVPVSNGWAPTPQIGLYTNLKNATTTNGYLTLQIHFTNTGTTSFQIDDIYVDPRRGV